jgi:hypothetical protein
VFCGEGEEGFKVALPRSEIELSPLDFVQVPKDVNAQRVETERLYGEHSVFPIFFGDTRIVQLPRTYRSQLQNIVNGGFSIFQPRLGHSFIPFLGIICLFLIDNKAKANSSEYGNRNKVSHSTSSCQIPSNSFFRGCIMWFTAF